MSLSGDDVGPAGFDIEVDDEDTDLERGFDIPELQEQEEPQRLRHEEIPLYDFPRRRRGRPRTNTCPSVAQESAVIISTDGFHSGLLA